MDTEIVRMRDAFAHIHAFIHFGSYHTHQIVRALPSCATGFALHPPSEVLEHHLLRPGVRRTYRSHDGTVHDQGCVIQPLARALLSLGDEARAQGRRSVVSRLIGTDRLARRRLDELMRFLQETRVTIVRATV